MQLHGILEFCSLSYITFSIFLNILGFFDRYSMLRSYVLENYARLFTDLALGPGLIFFFLIFFFVSLQYV